MGTVFDILILLAIAAVAVTLGFGVRSLYQTGPEARSRSNKLMRLRVALQALAIALLLVAMWWKSTYGA
ncbi:MAG: twin transmembrane helix small protein [Pseudomonadota bacterium]|nr:twin transmembrane helix small protein [Pseudomonadota bacterium]